MSIKSKAYLLKDRAKELGYDLKITHCQEIVSKLEGFSNRHSALIDSKNNERINLNLELYLKNSMNDFNIKNDLTHEELHELQKRLSYTLQNELYEYIANTNGINLKVYLATDDANQTDCIIAYNEMQVKLYLKDFCSGLIQCAFL